MYSERERMGEPGEAEEGDRELQTKSVGKGGAQSKSQGCKENELVGGKPMSLRSLG